MPGTTVDDVEVRWNLGNKHAFLLDTAGLRRKANVKDPVEKISALRSLSVIDRSHMVLAVISVEDEIADQDIRVIKYAIDAGKAILVLLNKTDLVSKKDLKEFEAEIIYRLDDATYVPFHFISAKKGIGIAKITDLVKKLEREIHRNHDTKIVNHHLKIAQERHHLPAAQGTLRSKIYYGCQVGYFPKKILVFAKRPDWIPESYRRYVQNFFRKALKIKYLPLEVEFRKRQSIYKKNKK